MEMRLPAFGKGTKVLVVDQWVETGGTMSAAIDLVRRQGGIVAGLAAIAIEENETTDAYRKEFRCVSAVVQGSPWQSECNAQDLQSFKIYQAEATFPRIH
jgi:adenine phosphoribosyltransferase